MEAICWFTEIGLNDVGMVGGKGANLGELTTAGLPVPPGFVVTAAAYLEAISGSGARARLARLLSELNADDPISLTQTQRAAREEIMATPIPTDIADAIENAYRTLGHDVAVAVRSSGTTEDAGDSSFAGMNASFTNVIGLPNVMARVKDCWASLYGERVLAYRAEQQLTEEPAIAVIVQKMIFSEVSGVMFTADPTTGALDRMIIESVFGQGEAIVSGRVEPDTYILDKAGPQLISVRQGKQKFKIVRGPDGADVEQPLDAGEVDRRSLSQAEIIAIAELGLRAEQHYGSPQDLEWAQAAGATYLVQSRPITTLGGSGGIRAANGGFGHPDSLTLWLGGICRARVRAGTDPHLPQSAARVSRRRSPGRGDDKSGLGAGNAPRDRVDHRRRRRHLSRGDRLPRASAALRCRHRQRHYEPAYRPRSHRRRSNRQGVRRCGRADHRSKAVPTASGACLAIGDQAVRQSGRCPAR